MLILDVKIGQHWRCQDAVWEIVEISTKDIRGKLISADELFPIKIGEIAELSLNDPKYPNDNWVLILKDGMNCNKCGLFNNYVSQGNQADGTYKCYSCRN